MVGNDCDVDGDPLTVADHTQPANGEVACDESSCTYTPDRDFHGTDTFTYTVSDGDDDATATVTVTVDPVNDPPAAADDAADHRRGHRRRRSRWSATTRTSTTTPLTVDGQHPARQRRGGLRRVVVHVHPGS